MLRGELYSDTPIEPVFSFAEEVGDVDTATAEGYSGYQTLVDDTGAITIDVPNEWTDIDHRTARARRRHAVPVHPGVDRQSPRSTATYDVPGLFYVGARRTPTTSPARSPRRARLTDECTTDNGVTDYDDGVFTGQYQYWSGCGASGAELRRARRQYPGDVSYTAVIAVQILTRRRLGSARPGLHDVQRRHCLTSRDRSRNERRARHGVRFRGESEFTCVK